MVLLVFVYGIVIGSFLNVCIYRMPEGISIVKPRSSCGSCGHELLPLDLVPIFSYLFNLGKCRHCGKSYSSRYMFVELLTGLLFILSYYVYGLSFEFFIGAILSSIVVVVTFIDIDHHIILDRFSIFVIALGIIYQVVTKDNSITSIVLGFLIGGGLLFIIAIIGTMGGGDIKIMASLGILLGARDVIIAFYLAFVIGAMIMLPIVIYRKKKGKFNSEIAFGPFLTFASLAAFLFGDDILNLYLNILNV